MLNRHAQQPVAPPESKMPRSTPIAIGNGFGRDKMRSPMESDDDTTFAMGDMPRSWDDIEGARSILNLNSPNGFHPGSGALPSAFMLPIAAASAPERTAVHLGVFARQAVLGSAERG